MKTLRNIHSSNGYSTATTIHRLNERAHEKAFLNKMWPTKKEEEEEKEGRKTTDTCRVME